VVGLVSMTVGVFFPNNILYVPQLMTETIFTTLMLLITWIILVYQKSWLRKNMILGVLIGIAVLIRATALVLPAAILLYNRARKVPWSLNIRDVALISATLLLVVSPWILRNYSTFNRFALTSNSGVNFWMGNHPGASGAYSYPKTDNPLISVKDDFDRSDLGYRLGIEFMGADPVQYFILLGKKFAHFFGTDYWLVLNLEYKPLWAYYPNAATIYSELSIWSISLTHGPFIAILLLGIFGLSFSKDGTLQARFLFASFIVLWLAVHLVFYAGARYRFPIVPFFFLAGAMGIQTIRTRSVVFSKLRVALFILFSTALVGGWVAERWTIYSRRMDTEKLKEFLNTRPDSSTIRGIERD